VAVAVHQLSAAMQQPQMRAVQVEQDRQIQSPAHQSLAQAAVVDHQTVAQLAQAVLAAVAQVVRAAQDRQAQQTPVVAVAVAVLLAAQAVQVE
jgi:hypothetical protein